MAQPDWKESRSGSLVPIPGEQEDTKVGISICVARGRQVEPGDGARAGCGVGASQSKQAWVLVYLPAS